MEEKEKSPEQELIESISLMLNKGLETNTDIYTGILKSISGKKAVVTMNGQDQNVAVVSPDLLAGMVTRVFVPNGNMSNAFIIGGGGSDEPDPDPEPTLPTVQIVTGNYTGTGKYGSSNKRTLTFDFTPKFVFVTNDYTSGHGFSSFVYGATQGLVMYTSQVLYRNILSWSNNSVTWYCTSNANGQLNVSGHTYYYFAIGY